MNLAVSPTTGRDPDIISRIMPSVYIKDINMDYPDLAICQCFSGISCFDSLDFLFRYGLSVPALGLIYDQMGFVVKCKLLIIAIQLFHFQGFVYKIVSVRLLLAYYTTLMFIYVGV